MKIFRRFPSEDWPYGVYWCDHFVVLFDRRYRPLVRMRDREPRLWVPAHTRFEPHPIGIPLANAERCSPDQRIENILANFWLHGGVGLGNPEKDRVARNVLSELVCQIPELAQEIVARSRK